MLVAKTYFFFLLDYNNQTKTDKKKKNRHLKTKLIKMTKTKLLKLK